MNRLAALGLATFAFYCLVEGRDGKPGEGVFLGAMGWACALVNRAELEDFKRKAAK